MLATIALRPAAAVPICFVLDDDGGASGSTHRSTTSPSETRIPELARVRDIARLPAVALLVDRWSEDWSPFGWVRLEARADLLEPRAAATAEHAAAVAELRAKYPQYATHRLEDAPDHPDRGRAGSDLGESWRRLDDPNPRRDRAGRGA